MRCVKLVPVGVECSCHAGSPVTRHTAVKDATVEPQRQNKRMERSAWSSSPTMCPVVLSDHSDRGTCPETLLAGESCTPTCRAGFSLHGKLACGSDGRLAPATCVPASCAPPPAVPHVRAGHCDRVLRHGESCAPDCDPGYELLHDARCDHGRLRTARCRPASCAPIVAPDHGHRGDCPPTLESGGVCRPSCDDGFDATDVTRCDHGVVTLAQCLPQRCTRIAPPAHGTIGSCPHRLDHGESCTPECRAGFELTAATVCRYGIVRTGECIPAGCDTTVAIDLASLGDCPPRLAHGQSCTPGDDALGDEPAGEVTCAYGQLSLPAFLPKPCEAVEPPPDATRGDCAARLEHGQSCTPKCRNGYELTERMTCDRGVLHTPECRPKSCAVAAPAHGTLGDGRLRLAHDESVRPTCDEGYEADGWTSCAFGTAFEAKCVAKSCPVPRPPVDGAVGQCTVALRDGQSCAPSCDEGFALVEPTRCQLGELHVGRCAPVHAPLDDQGGSSACTGGRVVSGRFHRP